MDYKNAVKKNVSLLPGQINKDILSTIKHAIDKLDIPVCAIALGGGWKYGEITTTDNNIKTDIDIYIFSNWLPFYKKRLIELEKEINRDNSVKIDFHGIMPLFINKSKTFWSYKIKQEAILITGNIDCINQIKAERDNICFLESLRIILQTVSNRLLNINTNNKINSYSISKLYLSLGEACLTYYNELAPSYKERLSRIKRLASDKRFDDTLFEKIENGYEIKLNYKAKNQTINLNTGDIKKDCIAIIRWLLDKEFGHDNLDNQLKELADRSRPKYLWNILFYLSIQEMKPKFITTIFQFKITDLYMATIYHLIDRHETRDKLIKKYFNKKNLSSKSLARIFKAWPIPTTVEIN